MADVPALDLSFARGDPGALEDRLYATIDDYHPLAVEELNAPAGWRIYFPTREERNRAAAAIASGCGTWIGRITPTEIPDEDWARRSQARLTAVKVGRIVVSPPWDPAAGRFAPEDDSILIVIEPSSAFGTGHHASTRLCLAMLQRTSLEGRRVIDVGTGSGVLAIAAAKLGATAILAIDLDPEALHNARENVTRNDVGATMEIRQEDLRAAEGLYGDVVVANLTGTALQQHAHLLTSALAPEGELIVSGFTLDELASVERSIGMPAAESLTEEGWGAARFTAGPTGT